MSNDDDDKVISLAGKKSRTKPSTPKSEETKTVEYCSFCGRPNTQVLKLVKGPGVNICSECTMIAVQYLILEDRMPSGEAQRILDAFWTKV